MTKRIPYHLEAKTLYARCIFLEMLCEILLYGVSSSSLAQVGGHSEVEVGEVKDRLNDALNATRRRVH